MSPKAKQLIHDDFLSFARRAFRHMHNGEKLGYQKYIAYLCYELTKVITGETSRLLINLPPRHLKTYLGALFLTAYTLGINPAARIIIVTYNDDLAKMISRDIRKILRSAWFKEVFDTRLAKDHDMVGDFRTTRNGGVYAVSQGGALAGYGADLIIFDDPLDLKDWNDAEKVKRVFDTFTGMIMSRFNHPKRGKVVVICHRMNDDDFSSHILEGGDFRHVALSFMAARTRTYDIGYTTWLREQGTILRPDAFSKRQIARLPTKQVAPPYHFYYQQGLGAGTRTKIRPEWFPVFSPYMVPISPVVLSIDPSQKAKASSSYNVIQAWTSDGGRHFLLDQWRDQCGLSELQSRYFSFVRKYRPSVALIEETANGLGLIERARKSRVVAVVGIAPDHRSKTERLFTHLPTIRKKLVYLPDQAGWREVFVAELVAFPSADFDDQVDALTQYLDFMATRPQLTTPARRAMGVITGNSLGPLGPLTSRTLHSSRQSRIGVVRLNSRWPFG